MLNLHDLYRLRLAGMQDTLSLAGVFGGMMLAHPVFTSTLGMTPALGVGAAALGAYGLAHRTSTVFKRPMFESDVVVNSDTKHQSEQWRDWDGMLIGYCVDTGLPITVPWDDWMRHAFIGGQSGVGKTVLGEWLMFQQIAKGGGLLWIDGKLDEANLAKLDAMCAWAGRRDDLLVINPGMPEMSNTYNPILYGDADEVSARVLSLIPSSEGNAGTDYYRQASNQGITTLVGAIQHSGLAYNFLDLTILLQNQRALEYLERLVPDGDQANQLAIFLEQYKSITRDGMVSIDLKKLRDTFGGVGGRMYQFGSGNFGKITNSYTPEVNLFEAIRSNKIVYVALPTMGKAEAASNFGKMVVGDFRTAISWIQALPESERPWPPFLGFFDEAGSYVTDSWSRIFEQARSAHLAMLPAVQTMANLDAISKELREMVIGNTMTKIAFKIGTAETREEMALLMGTERVATLSVSNSDSGSSNNAAGTGHTRGVSESVTSGITEREEEVYRINPNTLGAIGKGEAIVTIENSKIYHVKIPRVTFDEEFMRSIGPFQLNRSRKRWARGLDLGKDISRWLSSQN